MTTAKKKHNKFRKNISQYVDSDYKHKLNDEELKFLEQFEDEYYSNGLVKQDSIHRKALTEEQFIKAKNETFTATNCQNRDVYGIAATSSNYLKFIDDDNNYIEPVKDKDNSISRITDPQYAFNVLLEQTMDEMNNHTGRDIKTILVEYGIELVKLGASLRPDRVKTAIKRANAKKGDK